MPDQSNDAASDLWSQMFARAAEHPAAAKMGIKYHASSDTDKARKAFAAAGWNEASIDAVSHSYPLQAHRLLRPKVDFPQ